MPNASSPPRLATCLMCEVWGGGWRCEGAGQCFPSPLQHFKMVNQILKEAPWLAGTSRLRLVSRRLVSVSSPGDETMARRNVSSPEGAQTLETF